jgi:ERCC4-type nuclease
MELIIDTREKGLIELLNKNLIEFKIEQLELGDILLRKNEEIELIIERKTINDLKASICDGRNREQKARLLKSFPTNRILYMIEGNFDKDLNYSINGLPVSTLVGSMINTLFRDDIKIYKTNSIEESLNFLIKLKDKFEKDANNFFNKNEEVSDEKYSSTLKKSKKANMTPNVWYISQLSLIPQVTEKIASVIFERYKSIHELLKEYENTPEHLRCKLLADLNYPLQTGKTRRIGNVISERIYKFFYSINE